MMLCMLDESGRSAWTINYLQGSVTDSSGSARRTPSNLHAVLLPTLLRCSQRLIGYGRDCSRGGVNFRSGDLLRIDPATPRPADGPPRARPARAPPPSVDATD